MGIHYKRGMLLYEQRQYPHAGKEFREELATNPEDANCNAMLGLTLFALDKVEDADRQTQRALGLSPDSPFCHYAHAFVLFHRAKISEAEKFVKQAIELNATQPHYYALLAEIYLAQDRWQQAADAAASGLADHPENLGCLNSRARALVRLGQVDQAAGLLESALSRNPESAMSHTNMGWVCINQGQAEKAFEHYREALRLSPNLDVARQGVVLALKQRHFFWAPFLTASLALGRMKGTMRMALVLCIILFIKPLQPLVVLFIALNHVSQQMFNFMIGFDPMARRVLRPQDVIESRVFVGWLVVGLCLAVVFVWRGFGISVYGIMLGYLGLASPLVRIWDVLTYRNKVVALAPLLVCVAFFAVAVSFAMQSKYDASMAAGCASLGVGILFRHKRLEKRWYPSA